MADEIRENPVLPKTKSALPMWVEYHRLDALISAMRRDNPKDHDIGEIGNSIARHGYNDPVSVNDLTGTILTGHGRVKTLWQKHQRSEAAPQRILVDTDGMWLIPVLHGISYADDSEALAYVIAHNETTIKGGWVEQLLADALGKIQSETQQLLGTGFDADELDAIIKRLNPMPPGEFPEYSPETLETEHQCPKCGYEWSGKAK